MAFASFHAITNVTASCSPSCLTESSPLFIISALSTIRGWINILFSTQLTIEVPIIPKSIAAAMILISVRKANNPLGFIYLFVLNYPQKALGPKKAHSWHTVLRRVEPLPQFERFVKPLSVFLESD